MNDINPSASKSLLRSLDTLYFDPNNFRWLDHPEAERVPEKLWFDSAVQTRVKNRLYNHDAVWFRELALAFETHGFLPLEPVLVEQVGKRFLVLDGNRRIALLKFIAENKSNPLVDVVPAETAVPAVVVPAFVTVRVSPSTSVSATSCRSLVLSTVSSESSGASP